MKKIIFLGLIAFSSSVFAAANSKLDQVRIGWQVPWTLQGQLVQVLKHTDILKRNGLQAEFIGKTYGPELNELALAGQVDVILTADQPAAILFGQSRDWKIAARLMYNRTSTYVPPGSPLKNLKDLKGKTVGVPFGAAAERILHQGLISAGLQKQDVQWVNLGMLEHGPLIQKGVVSSRKQTWGQFDALSGFDPIPALLEAQGLVRTLHTGKVCSLILVNQKTATAKKDLLGRLVKSFSEAYAFYRDNRSQANAWFLAEAQLKGGNDKAMSLTEEFEPNLKPGAEIRMTLNSEDLEMLQQAADFVALKTGKTVQMKDWVLSSAQSTVSPP